MISKHKFQNKIFGWYRRHGRHDLPWRHTRDPYKIFVSEIMLQQTHVEHVVPKYKSFLRVFPTVVALARAPQNKVLRVWQGLGYNRRALYLKRAAESIVKDHVGKFPKDPHELLRLPGVGQYTARAITAFAYNKPEIFIETNIRRVFIHFFFANKKKVTDAKIMKCIEQALPISNSREWYWALMDYGALALKNISNPNRKSKIYVRQSRFKGSRRYARAKTLDFLLKRKHATANAILKFFSQDLLLKPYKPHDILTMLQKDGFITRKNARWTLC